jgi:hypothetical protein
MNDAKIKITNRQSGKIKVPLPYTPSYIEKLKVANVVTRNLSRIKSHWITWD